MTIIEDKAQQANKHNNKHQYWEKSGVDYIQLPLPVADYILMNDKVQDVINRKAHRGIEVKKMDLLGTYTVAVDTKKDLQEIISNICGAQHDRFRDECLLAQNNGIKMYVLIEDDGGYCDKKQTIYNKPVTCIEDLCSWKNPRLFIWQKGKQKYPSATKGQTLAKAMLSMESKYGVEFQFCTKEETGKRIIELLGDLNDRI